MIAIARPGTPAYSIKSGIRAKKLLESIPDAEDDLPLLLNSRAFALEV
jgi:hypothetical protein